MSEEKKHEFWVTNVSDRNVSLTDLATTIPAHTSRNLLGKKSQHTLEQLEASAKSGSIFLKRDKIRVRNVPPQQIVTPGIQVVRHPRWGKNRSLVQIKEVRYAELDFSDEQFVGELSDIDLPVAPPVPEKPQKK